MAKNYKSRTKAQARFASVPGPQIQRSQFNRSHGHKTTFDGGFLVPIFVDEAVPGDTFELQATLFGRIATLLHPILDQLWLDTFYFAVPLRLVWDNFEKFMGAQDNPGDTTDYTVPIIDMDNAVVPAGSIYDYLGWPTGVTGVKGSALFLRAANLCYNEWFRDENILPALPINTDDGPDSFLDYPLSRRGKRHDYMTSALPWPQKGAPVTIGLGSTAPVIADPSGDAQPKFDVGVSVGVPVQSSASDAWFTPGSGAGNVKWSDPELVADLSQATATTINELREAFQIQRMLERDARGGTRYAEKIRAHFGVISPDARLQRPEYLGGGTQPLMTREVPATAQVTGGAPQAELAAYGTITHSGRGFRRSFTEHMIIIGFACLRADLTYQQGLERMWRRSTVYDFYWPTLSHLGEQTIDNAEIYYQGTSVDDDPFGYQERYAEYRYKPSRVSGLFRSDHPQSLDTWHLAQDFADLPLLSSEFIQEDPPIDRIIAVQDEPHLLLDCWFNLRCTRPMPTYSVPGLIDHL